MDLDIEILRVDCICSLCFYRALQNKKNKIPEGRRRELEEIIKTYYDVTAVSEDLLKEARELDYR